MPLVTPQAATRLYSRNGRKTGVTIRPDAIDKQSTIRLATLSADQGVGFLKVMDWMVETLRVAPADVGA